MLHNMKLNNAPFEMIENGRKTIELRLNDEKRRKVQINDFIEFSHIDEPDRKIQVRVTSLHHFNSFNELFSEIPKEKYGFKSDEIIAHDYMDTFYTRENQEKYGVLGIEFRKTELQKFIDAQEHSYGFGETYQTALKEIKQGMKMSCWMWYVFPQIKGLSISGTITSALLDIENNDPVAVFGIPDAYKLRSCMTLFKHAAPDNELFHRVLEKFCQGIEDENTLEKL